MTDNEDRIVLIGKCDWYVTTVTGFEGPFEDKGEARQYLRLIQATEAARVEFAGLDFRFR